MFETWTQTVSEVRKGFKEFGVQCEVQEIKREFEVQKLYHKNLRKMFGKESTSLIDKGTVSQSEFDDNYAIMPKNKAVHTAGAYPVFSASPNQ